MLRLIVYKYMKKLKINTLQELLALMNKDSDFNFVLQHLTNTINEYEPNFRYLIRLEEVFGLEKGILQSMFDR